MRLLLILTLLFSFGTYAEDGLDDYRGEDKIDQEVENVVEAPEIETEKRDYTQNSYDEDQPEEVYLGDYEDVNDIEHPPYETE